MTRATPVDHEFAREMATDREWLAIDWVMKAISVTTHIALQHEQGILAADLDALHEKARKMRDAA